MTLGTRLREARKRMGYTQRQLAQIIGAKHNSISNWEKGLNMPDPITIEAICAALNVTPNDLLMGESFVARMTEADGLTTEEAAFIKKYRVLDMGARGALNALMGYYFELAANKTVNASGTATQHSKAPDTLHDVRKTLALELIQGMISTQSVAAGTGTYLNPDAFDSISVVANNLTRRADFYVPVSGNSMEPKFRDGDILIVENTAVQHNEIGIFTLDGYGFVKIRGKSELISINPDYAPIPMNDDIICNGKVIGILEREWLAD